VLAHGGRFSKESWDKQAQFLSQHGFRVLAIDFRGYGQTIAGTETSDEKSYPDVLAAVRYLHSAGARSVSIVGASMGGDAAADAAIAARPGEIERIVFLVPTEAPRPNAYRDENSSSSAATIRAPTVLGFPGFPSITAVPRNPRSS